MSSVSLENLYVSLRQPVVVGEKRDNCWFAGLAKFASGDLFAGFSIAPDRGDWLQVQNHGGCVALSSDGGETWGSHYPTYYYNAAKGILPDDSLLMFQYANAVTQEGAERILTGPYVRFTDAGRQLHFESDGMRVLGIVREVRRTPSGWLSFHGASEIITMQDGRLLVLASPVYEGNPGSTLEALASDDLGRTWQHLGTVGRTEDVESSENGPNESAVVRLTSGELLAVCRVGSREPYHKAYSSDGGESWSPLEVMDGPFSVKPQLLRLKNGVLALSGGRSGTFLWLCNDGHGDHWQAVDLVAHHNAVMGPEHHIRLNAEHRHDPDQPEQTTSYTGMVEIEPNVVVVLYDRTPFGWKPVPKDSPERSRVYAVRISIAAV